MPASEDVLLKVEGAVAVITLNRPARRNALTVPMLTSLRKRLGEVAASDARVLILHGAGQDFCVGADMKAAPDDAPKPTDAQLAHIYETGVLLHEMPQVTIAAIDGGCAGPGLAWAAACDFRFASNRAVFNSAFLGVGVAGEMGLAWSLLRVVGGGAARELLLFPGKFDAAEARRIGLVSRVFPAATLLAQAQAAAAELAARDPAALRAAKANLLSAETLSLADFVAVEGARHIELSSRPTLRKGFDAFLTKRPPGA